MVCFRYLTILFTVIFSWHVQAKPLTAAQVPEPLQAWIDWVLQDVDDYQCPILYNSGKQRRCSWPARLQLNFDDSKGKFAMHWQVYAETWVQLPGSQKNWPQNITVNRRPALVMERKGRPAIKLAPGSYKLEGEFKWDYIPDYILIPQDTGLIELTVNGKAIEIAGMQQGQLWLKENVIGKAKPENSLDKLDIQVFRRIIDEVPLQVLTRIELDVSGEPREINLASPLLQNFIPMNLQSQLATKLEADNNLLIQVRPGSWFIEILARHVQEVTQLSLSKRPLPWPEEEIWVFDARPYQRLVEIENLTPIDPQQTNLLQQWKKFPAYRIKAGESMGFKVIRRGDPDPEPNSLTLQRSLWLDFDGQGYTINDKINGKMTHGWRLNVVPELDLGQVNLDGKNQLITFLPGTDKRGIEVRKGQLNLSADSRFSGPINALSAVGWEQTFQQVSAELNLPPGWRLLAASGVDNVPNSWISRWTLLDLFLVLIAALAIARLWNVYWGLFALFTLVIIWHEPSAPHYVWLNILAATALLTVLHAGKLYAFIKWYRNLAWFTLVLLVVPFMVDQVRTGLYPQLEKPWQRISGQQYSRLETVQTMAESMPIAEMAMLQAEKNLRRVPAAKRPARDYYDEKSLNFDRIDPKAKVQTGPGLPQWHWKRIQLSWNGPVNDHQQMRFWFINPMTNMLLNFLRVVLITVLSLLMFGLLSGKTFANRFPFIVWLLLLPIMMFPGQEVYADFPDQSILEDLKKRMLAAPDCLPDCAQISLMQLTIDPEVLTIKLQVHSQQHVAVPIPAQFKQWFPSDVLVDGKIASALYRSNDGRLWLNLVKGRHEVVIRGNTPLLNQFTLSLPLAPHRVEINAQEWLVEGVHDYHIADKQLNFTRINNTETGNQQAQPLQESVILPPFVRVERTLQLGLDWRVKTRVIRVTPADSAVVLEVPLLAGEALITPGVRIKDDKVLVNMPPRKRQMQWESVLKKKQVIAIQAAHTDQWTEIWRADVSPIWHIKISGIAVVHHQDKQGRWLPEWRPWPGEKVSLTITRPESVQGQTLTLESSQLKLQPGKRAMEAALTLRFKSSQGSQHNIDLPEQALLQSVKIDGKTQPIRKKGTQVTLPIKPGNQQVSLTWRESSDLKTILQTPVINLNIPSVNSSINIILGEDRWVLLTAGPKIGPAVLFWGILVVLVILAVGLGRISITPLRPWQWFLLLTGLSQIPLAAAFLVVFWLIALGLRGSKQPSEVPYFNAAQILVGLLTIAALGFLFIAIEQGLLGSPDMQITGNQSSAFNLNWYQDRSEAQLPMATVISVPLMAYRLLMLAWSLWLAVALLNWLKWGWGCYANGGLWIKSKRKQQKALDTEKKEAE
jgi:hypothetical protein